MSQRHITLSTCGLINKMYDLADEDLQITLAVSLHAPNDAIRNEIMPVSKANPLADFTRKRPKEGSRSSIRSSRA